jgi:prepilin signal peptidase PulO-like enzyme (type II secretory pathway)
MTSDLPPAVALWLLAAWLLMTGGAIGSFLNVVVYRLPVGISLVRPRSHCPNCKRPIRWHDNVPILAWFMLRGRCRDCGSAISARYPAVEAAAAALFLIVGLREGLAVAIYHLTLLCTLFPAALIQYDRRRPPLLLFLPALVIGFFMPLAWPEVRAAGLWTQPMGAALGLGKESVLGGMATGIAGLAAGILLAWVFLACPRLPAGQNTASEASRTGAWLAAGACVGLYLQWQAVCMLAPSAAALHWVLNRLCEPDARIRRVPAIAYLAVGAMIWILAT